MRQTLLHQPMQIPSLMPAMEIAQPDMYDARGQLRSIIDWDQHAFGQLAQIGVGQLHRIRHQLIQFPPSTFSVCAVM